jgi:hypothetical protein
MGLVRKAARRNRVGVGVGHDDLLWILPDVRAAGSKKIV